MGCPVAWTRPAPRWRRSIRSSRTPSRRGRQVIIIGDPVHPEVTAIAGWCTGAKMFRNATELGEFLKEYEENPAKTHSLWFRKPHQRIEFGSPCREKVKKECTNAEIFDTICDATCKRQSEAQPAWPQQCDAMMVIGDRKSSNTKRLGGVMPGSTVRWFCRIERAEELDLAAC